MRLRVAESTCHVMSVARLNSEKVYPAASPSPPLTTLGTRTLHVRHAFHSVMFQDSAANDAVEMRTASDACSTDSDAS